MFAKDLLQENTILVPRAAAGGIRVGWTSFFYFSDSASRIKSVTTRPTSKTTCRPSKYII